MRNKIVTQHSEIAFTDESLDELAKFLKTHPFSSILIVSDHQVFALHGESLMNCIDKTLSKLVEPMLFAAGEQNKNLMTVEQCWTHMQAMGLDRKSLVIGLGGGVVTDLSGFAAACYMRGIAHIAIPTTLMGMVDAAIGGKTGINLPTGKNLVGAFHHPLLILIAPHTLMTLPNREFRSGLAEVIKYGVIKEAPFFEYLENNMEEILEKKGKQLEYMIQKSCEIKVEIIEKDETETGLRAILNWGHTFAHAIETLTHYSLFLHGEAVSIGMCCAAVTSEQLGLVEHSFVRRVRDLCHQAGLPTKLPSQLNLEALLKLMRGDKKSISGKLNLVLANKIGHVELVSDIDPEAIKRALSHCF